VLVIAMGGAYLLAHNLSGGLQVSQLNVLKSSSRAVADRATRLYDYHRQEAQRVAFTVGVADAIRNRDAEWLQPVLESLARINNMDSVIVTDRAGLEVLGVQRAELQPPVRLAVSTGTDLGQQAIVRAVIDDAFVGATGFLRTPDGVMLYTAVPVRAVDDPVGIVLVGQRVSSVLDDLRSSAVADVALYGPDGALLQTSYPPGEGRQALTLSREVFIQALLAVQQIPVQSVQLDGVPYQAAYQPFVFGPGALGVVGTLLPDNIPYVTETGRQLTALLAASLAGVAVMVAFAGISQIGERANQIARVAGALTLGQRRMRTGMKPHDEISTAGYALDRYADYSQARQDTLQRALRRQRREINHLVFVLESMPDGVVVQDLEGRVVFMNDHARDLLGSHLVFRSNGLQELAEVVREELGPALAPGIYMLGDPHRVSLDDRMLSAQAAAVMSMSDHRLGSVILLRDITEQVHQEQEREALLRRLAHDIQQPLEGLGRAGFGAAPNMIDQFAREVTRYAVALQKMIIDMRELASVDTASVKRRQRPLRLETLIWAVANEWRQIALACDLTLYVMIEHKGLYVLGDEKRLRWALGSIVDNAIKYTPPGGALTLEIQGETDGMASLRVRDNGVGIAREERSKVFTRFYRGTPVAADGQVIRVPGMGQGLYIARQIFEAHGGKILLKSTQGKGTAIYMSLPLTAPVSMELPRFEADMDGETVQLSEEVIAQVNRRN
jgi:two-component system, OmpR family, sensor histidine kinase VicK